MKNLALESLRSKILYSFPFLEIRLFTDHLDDTVFHFQVSERKKGNKEARGFGSDFNACVALKNGFSEYLERKIFLEGKFNAKSSSGFAAHPEKEEAVKRSSMELVERDAFMWMWLSKTPPLWLEHDELSLLGISNHTSFLKKVKKMGFKVRFGIVTSSRNCFVVCALIISTRNSFGYILATSAHQDPAQAILSVFYDVRVAIGMLISRSSISNHNKYLLKANKPYKWSPISHIYTSINAKEAPDWLLSNRQKNVKVLPLFDIKTEIVKKFSHPYNVYVARSTSDQCLKYFVGPTTLRKLNFKRLQLLGLKLQTLNFQVHPLA